MSTVNLKLEQIKEEDFIDEEFITDKIINKNKTRLTECGRVFLDLDMNTMCFSCLFCAMTLAEVNDLIEHVNNSHSDNLDLFSYNVSYFFYLHRKIIKNLKILNRLTALKTHPFIH